MMFDATTKLGHRSTRMMRLDMLERCVRNRLAAGGMDRNSGERLFLDRLLLVLFGLPAPIQVGLPVAMIRHAMPPFQDRPSAAYIEDLLRTIERLAADPREDAYVSSAVWKRFSQENTPDLPYPEHEWLVAATNVCEAVDGRRLPEMLATAAATATNHAIWSSTYRARWASDPARADLANRHFRAIFTHDLNSPDYDFEEVTDFIDAPVVCVAYAEGYKRAVSWLRAADLSQYPEVADRDAVAGALRRWHEEPGGILRPGMGRARRARKRR